MLQPVGPRGMGNFERTVRQGVRLESLSLSVEDSRMLARSYPGRRVRVWGVSPGTSERNHNQWLRLRIGDVVLFTGGGGVIAIARVFHKTDDPRLASQLWPTPAGRQPWRYIYFLCDVQIEIITERALNLRLGYRAGAHVQNTRVIERDKVDRVLELVDELGFDRKLA